MAVRRHGHEDTGTVSPEPAVRVVGAAQLRRTLRAAGRELDDLKDANAAAAAYVAAVARTTAPRRSGRLASSLRGNRAAGRARVSAGGASLPYAGPIHWGWPARGIEPQPWVSEAAEQTQPVWLGMYRNDVQQALDKVKGA